MLQKLYWQGTEYNRDSPEYTKLIERAFDAYAQNSKVQKLLLSTNDAVFEHTMGKKQKNFTVLTRNEFVSNLTRIRKNLRQQKDAEKDI